MMHMQILGTVVFLFNKCFKLGPGILIMNYASSFKISCLNRDLKGGFWSLGCLIEISRAVLLIFMIILGFKALQLGCIYKGLLRLLGEFRGKSSDLKNGFCLGIDVCGLFYSKILSCMVGISRFAKTSGPSSAVMKNFEGNCKEVTDVISNSLKINESSQEEDEDDGGYSDSDEEMDIEALKRAIKIERQQRNAAYLELEEERKSATFAANEALAMVLRLQNEKSSIEIEANQYRRMAEQKQQYDQEVIQSLDWIISKHESDRRILVNQLNLCRQKLKLYLKNDEGDQVLEELDQILISCHSTIEDDDLTDGLLSSLDMADSSLM